MEQRSCKNCSSEFTIEDEDLKFYEKVSPVFNGKKYLIREPTFCPDCRQQRRLLFENQMQLYKRKCDFSGESIISMYSPDKPYKVYKSEIWWSDKWDPMKYGRDFDFSRPFFEQFDELMHEVPQVTLGTNFLMDENADYTNYAGHNKDCYMIFHADYNRDCYYSYGLKKCENTIDIFNVFDSQLCYECIDCHKCYNLYYSQDCVNCSDGYFLKDCIGCKNCFGCKNLHQKQYYIFNKKHTKEEFEAYLKNLNLSSRKSVKELKKKCREFFKTLPNKYLRMIKCENSYGDFLYNCRNVKYSYDIEDMRDGKYCFQIFNGAKDCMDVTQFGLNIELVYEGSVIGYNAHTSAFCHMCNEQISDMYYCMDCYHSSILFGCTGLRHKHYCILNKQYSKEEYEDLMPQIIEHMKKTGEWGEFFDPKISHFGYNETTALHYFPITKEEALEKGYKWKDEDKREYLKVDYKVPDDIKDVPDSINKEIFACEKCGKNYKIIEQELQLYRRFGLPVPRKCFECRHHDRMKLRNPRKLWDRKCDKCGTDIKTSYSKDRPEKVYCEKCYLESIV